MSTKVYKRNECCLGSSSADHTPAAMEPTVVGARNLGNDHPVETMMIMRVSWLQIFSMTLQSCAGSRDLVGMETGV